MAKITSLPNHIAIILDGNGRWAKRRGLPRSMGHYYGAMNLVRIATYANKLGINMMSVYAFSTENWNRPKDEVDYLMTKPVELINENLQKIKDSNIKVLIKGRRDRISDEILKTIEKLEEATKDHDGLILNVCFDYGSFDEITHAAKSAKDINETSIQNNLYITEPVDLLIRTGGELRLSNFLLWQSAYAELYFTKTFWPQFKERNLNKALKEFSKRDRRFGGIKKQ
ncbi:MAG TPA: polyprenyl diphosphate synthase [Acholeplasma sp.]